MKESTKGRLLRARSSIGFALLAALFAACSTVSLAPEQLPTITSGIGSPPAPGPGSVELVVVDVGQGDAMVIRTARRTVVVDTGTRRGGERLLRLLRGLGVGSIDLLVLTHPHADHIGGARSLLAEHEVREVWINGVAAGTRVYQRTLQSIADAGVPVRSVRRGLKRELEADVWLRVLGPEDPLIRGTRSDANANSVVLWLQHGLVDFLLTGDAERVTEKRLLKALRGRPPPDFEVLKVAHHGSRYATGADLLRRVSPQVAVISVGHRNRYHHPHPETLDRLRGAGIATYRTDLHGTIRVRSDGRSFRVYVDRMPARMPLGAGGPAPLAPPAAAGVP